MIRKYGNMVPEQKVLVVTGYGNQKDIDDWHLVSNLTFNSKNKWCQKHGYDILHVNFFEDVRQKTEHLGFLRVIKAIDLLQNNYDVVLWLDGDTLVTNQEMTIDNILQEKQHTLYFSYDWIPNSFQVSSFAVRNTPFANTVKEYLYDHFEVENEQLVLNTAYSQNRDFRREIKVLPHNFLNAMAKEVMETQWWLPPRNPIPEASQWREGCFLAHFGGISNVDRVSLMKKYYKEFI